MKRKLVGAGEKGGTSSQPAPPSPPNKKIKQFRDYCIFSLDEIVATILQFSSTTEFFACLKFVNKCFFNVIEKGLLSGLIFKTIYLDSSVIKGYLSTEKSTSSNQITLKSILQESLRKNKRSIAADDCFSKRSKLSEEKLLEIIENCNFAIKEWYSTNCLQVTERVLSELFIKCKQLTSVHLESSSIKQFILNPSLVPNLKHLILIFKSIKFEKISLVGGSSSSEGDYHQQFKFENLKYLSITVHLRDDSFMTQLGSGSSEYPNLKHFQFHTLSSPYYSNNSELSSTPLRTLHSFYTPNIKSISIKTTTYTMSFNGQHHHHVANDQMATIGGGRLEKYKISNLPFLKKLVVHNYSREEEKGIHIIDCPLLDTLSLTIKQETMCSLTLPKLKLLHCLELDIQSNIDFCSEQATFSTWVKHLTDLSSLLGSIRKLRVYSTNSSSISNWVIKDCKTLRKLFIDIPSINDLVIDNMSKLKCLDIRSSDLQLTIKNTKIEDDIMDGILNTCIISKLTLENCEKLTTIDLSKSSTSCKFFSISQCNDLKVVKCKNSIGGEIKNCRNVKHIHAPNFAINRANYKGKSKSLLVTGVHSNLKIHE